ncbi:uncharacterized protein LOC135689677 isoform X2 [Rhopilema esculentum]|uniref:uncharacterized protein LOC135689677 isoform X2 n=1 Tax=Rhopilema esculentum TaxID=499914 RepID=UPI0031D590F9
MNEQLRRYQDTFYRGCSFTLTRSHGIVYTPVLHVNRFGYGGVACDWTINSFSGQNIILKIPRVIKKADCDCSCFQLSITGEDGSVIKKLCSKDLPLTLDAGDGSVKIFLTGTGVSRLRKGLLFSYNVTQARNYNTERVTFDARKRNLVNPHNWIQLDDTNDEIIHRLRRDSDLKPMTGQFSSVVTVTEPFTGNLGNNSVSDTGKKIKVNKLPVILPAVLTVVIFIVCVALIAYKSYNAEDFPYDGDVAKGGEKRSPERFSITRSALDIQNSDEHVSCWPKRRNGKKHGRSEVYDVMLKEYKAEKRRKDPLRKSSTIQIEGVGGNDPQSIARKHLLLNRMRGGSTPGAVSTLIKLSSTAFIASSMVRDDKQETNEKHETIEEEDSTPLINNEEQSSKNPSPKQQIRGNGKLPDAESSGSEEGRPGIPKIELALSNPLPFKQEDDTQSEQNSPEGVSLSPDFSTDSKEKRNSGPVWFKYKRLEKQSYVADDSDEELDYDCAQHIHRILSASRENIEEARRILPDDVKDIILPKDLETALAEFELWPDSSV